MDIYQVDIVNISGRLGRYGGTDGILEYQKKDMGLTHELPIYRETYKLLLKIYQYTQGYSRAYKYTLGQDMKRDGLELVRSKSK